MWWCRLESESLMRILLFSCSGESLALTAFLSRRLSQCTLSNPTPTPRSDSCKTTGLQEPSLNPSKNPT